MTDSQTDYTKTRRQRHSSRHTQSTAVGMLCQRVAPGLESARARPCACLAQNIGEHLKRWAAGHHNLQLMALLPCLEEFVKTLHTFASLDGDAWPA
jgi:hypothetical protein